MSIKELKGYRKSDQWLGRPGRSKDIAWPCYIATISASTVALAVGLLSRRRGGNRPLGSIMVAGIVIPWAYQLIIRSWHLRWGATEDEAYQPLPGDDLVSNPWIEATRAVTINAPAKAVWPWLVQMGGYKRAGWYSYDLIDNASVPSANLIIPELQQLKVGDIMPTSPDGSGFEVAAIDPDRSLVLAIREPYVNASSSIVLHEPDERHTRLILRLRWRARTSFPGFLFFMLFDPGDFVMMRKQMLGIKERAEKG